MKQFPKPATILITLAIYTFLTMFLSITLVLGNAEIMNEAISFNLFLFGLIYIIGLVITLAMTFALFFIRKNNNLGDSIGFVDKGEKPSVSFFKRFTYPQLIWMSTIFFGWLFLGFNLLGSQSFTAFKFLPQQFSKIDSLLFSSLLIPGAEEMLSMAVISVSVLVLTILALKYKWSPKEYALYFFGTIPIIVGVFAVIWHMTAYSGSDVALVTVFFFWTIKTLIVLATGLFIIGFIIHFFNNFFIDFVRLFTSDAVRTWALGTMIGITLLYLLFYRKRLLGSKQNED